MRNYILFLICTLINVTSIAQMPPSNMYDNLGAYVSVAVYNEDGDQVLFNGTDYFFIDYVDRTEVNVLFFNPYKNRWESESADFVEQTSDYTKYTVMNPAGDDLTFIISPDRRDIIVAKDYEDISIAYELIEGNNNYLPSYTYPSGGSYNSGSSSGASSSGRTCISCNGTGKCKTCNGQGWYYHESGYYTGRSGKTRTDCPVCHGTGRCGTCHGNGSIR